MRVAGRSTRRIAAPASRLIHLHQDVGVVTRQQVAFSLDVGRPKTVDHVAGRSMNADGRADGNMDFIGGRDDRNGSCSLGYWTFHHH